MAYYVGYSTPGTFHTQEDNDLEKIFPLLPTEQTAKAVQDILNKPKDLGGLGWEYYADWFWEVSKKDIEARSANVWIKRWRKIDGWSIWDYKCYEIDMNNGYQDYELTEHGIPNYFSECWFIHVLVYKGDQLVEGSEIK